MTIQDLMSACQRRLVHLSQMREAALAVGDLERVSVIDAEAGETQNTLNQLATLP